MKLMAVLSRIKSILSSIWLYLRTGRQRKLYKQWVDQAELPSEAIPREESGVDRIRAEEEGGKKQSQLPMLFGMLLGACLVILCVLIILLVVSSC